MHPPPDGGRGVADGGGAHEGGQQVRVHRDHVRPGPRVQAQHAAVHRAVHCNQQASRGEFEDVHLYRMQSRYDLLAPRSFKKCPQAIRTLTKILPFPQEHFTKLVLPLSLPLVT